MKLYFRKNGVTKRLHTITAEVSGGGHVIQNGQGTDMPQEEKLQFPDSHISDDSTNGRTVVENVKEVAPADYASTTDEGIIVTDDGDDALIGPVSDDYVEVTADGVKTYATLYNELFALVDENKITVDAIIEQNGVAFSRVGYVPNSEIEFSYSAIGYQKPYIEMIRLKPSNSIIYRYSNDTFSDTSSSVPTNGKKITLYYGQKKAVVDLQTKAERCLMSDGVTSVESAINGIESLPSSVRAWSGDTLKFSIPQSNGVIYKFIAMSNVGDLVEACLINRADGLKVAHTSALTMSATYANGELTVTLPSTAYWTYSLTVIKSRH